jgi:hypothetical protein
MTWVIVPFPIPGCGGSVVTGPCQEPANVFSSAKDFCASDCPKAMVECDSRTTDSIKRWDFMFILIGDFLSLVCSQARDYSLASLFRIPTA